MLLIRSCLHFNNRLFFYKLAIFSYKVTIFSQKIFLSLPRERILIFYPQRQHFHRFRIILSFYLLNHPQLRKSGQVVGIRRSYGNHTAIIKRSRSGISTHKKSTCSSNPMDPESICHSNIIYNQLFYRCIQFWLTLYACL